MVDLIRMGWENSRSREIMYNSGVSIQGKMRNVEMSVEREEMLTLSGNSKRLYRKKQ